VAGALLRLQCGLWLECVCGLGVREFGCVTGGGLLDACCSASRSSAPTLSRRARSDPGWQLGTSAPGMRMPSGGAVVGVEGLCGPATGTRDWELWPVMEALDKRFLLSVVTLLPEVREFITRHTAYNKHDTGWAFFLQLLFTSNSSFTNDMGLRFLPELGSRKPTPKALPGHVPPSKASAEAPPPSASFADLIAAGTVVPDEREGPYALGSYHANVAGRGRGYTHEAGRREWFATNKATMALQTSWAIDLDHRQIR
jgi:hypothetical protein